MCISATIELPKFAKHAFCLKKNGKNTRFDFIVFQSVLVNKFISRLYYSNMWLVYCDESLKP